MQQQGSTDSVVSSVEALRESLTTFFTNLKKGTTKSKQITSSKLRSEAARIGEEWLVGISQDNTIKDCLDSNYLADLNIHFQRLLVFSEKATVRSKYDEEITLILRDFTTGVMLPLKQNLKNRSSVAKLPTEKVLAEVSLRGPVSTAFVGHSFSIAERSLIETLKVAFETIGVKIATGEKPKADRISEKVKGLIKQQQIFVGVFTRRDKISGKKEWTTSTWVIDEKAYAFANNKKLILLKETGVGSIGGIQGDYEFIEFSKDNLADLIVKLIGLFELSNSGLRD